MGELRICRKNIFGKLVVVVNRNTHTHTHTHTHIYIYRVSQEERTKLRESVPYVKLYRYNPKHLYPKLNGYGDNGQRKVWTSSISAYCTSTAVKRIDRETVTAQAPPNVIR